MGENLVNYFDKYKYNGLLWLLKVIKKFFFRKIILQNYNKMFKLMLKPFFNKQFFYVRFFAMYKLS